MKDHKEFDVNKERTLCREHWDLDTFIRDAAEQAIETKAEAENYLAIFSTKQLAMYCRQGYQKTQKTEKKVREELMRRKSLRKYGLKMSWNAMP